MKQLLTRAIRRVLLGKADTHRAGAVWRVVGRVTNRVFPTNASGNNTSMR